jgi:hypothetical protein
MQRPDEMDGPVKLKTENYITWRENVVAVVVGRRTNLGHFFVWPSVLPLDEACSICNRSKRRAPSMSWPLFTSDSKVLFILKASLTDRLFTAPATGLNRSARYWRTLRCRGR